jgi:NADPH-dependent 2,4-dienoyl-CoA reductase/sulfur reductase-like enzyme/rhodanese-related sulfurtransferase
MQKKIVIIGGVAAGATAAAKVRRLSESAEITLLERGPYVSYANCGLPYFISGDIKSRSKLLLQTPEGFLKRYNVNVKTETEALEIYRSEKKLKIRNKQGESILDYDFLILSQGGNPIFPEMQGSHSPHVFKLWTVPDMDRIHSYIEENQPKTAVVVGGGFIGLEMAEAFHTRKMKTTIVELAPQVMATMDSEFGKLIENQLKGHGMHVITGVGVKGILESSKEVELSDGKKIPAELVLFSVGVKPELSLAKQAGLEIGSTGGLLVNKFLQTSDPHIYAAGDILEITNKISDKKVRIPLAGPANRQGRIVAENVIRNNSTPYKGALGTSVVKIIDSTAASTGITEKAARDLGFDTGVVFIHKEHHASYYPGAHMIHMKLIFDKKNSKILGGQAFGREGVDKRIDVLAVAIHAGMTIEDLTELDLAYAPPYSSANDPINMISFVAQNSITGFSPTITPREAIEIIKQGDATLIDVRTPEEFKKGHVKSSINIPVDDIRSRLNELNFEKEYFVTCRVGYRGHLANRILIENNFKKVKNITGGYLSIHLEGGYEEEF